MSFNLAKCEVMHVGIHNPAYQRSEAGGDRGRKRHWRGSYKKPQSGRKSISCPRPAQKEFSLQGQAQVPEALQAICQAAPGPHYNLTRTYLLPVYMADWILLPK
jgi:hypothetical protein